MMGTNQLLMCLSLAVALSLAAATNPMEATSGPFLDRQVESSFSKLEDFVEKNCAHGQVDNADCLKKIQASQSIISLANLGKGSSAPNSLLYVNTIDRCTEKALKYIDLLLRFRSHKNTNPSDESRLTQLVESILVRASAKCELYLENLIIQLEGRVSELTWNALNDLFTSNVLTSGNSPAEILANAIMRDPNVSKQLDELPEVELRRFFENLVAQNVIKPCKDYLRTLSVVLKITENFGVSNESKQRVRAYFNHFSETFKDTLSLINVCKYTTKRYANIA